ncbi:DUF354 domain-containing protein [Halalkalicoccus sp. NIPERK01]|uniref:DUF354 domain-containing protein n=1 Tax=Halalkalicoccus sp. NIPERK01 TaxID=3053469 RepID=UPI00256EE168|nr:DUF354 domain-containing protein [Halalkalicoccus sp. NIPERK01]MDL5360607.1 DUF354 domain-containing protein [Halalkalicoccus sp. NIPERK01]
MVRTVTTSYATTKEPTPAAVGGGRVAWVDLVSPAHPSFFEGLLSGLSGLSVEPTVRRKTETVALSRAAGFDGRVIGRDFESATLRKAGIGLRTAELALGMPACDVSLSARNAMCVLASHLRGVPSIHFTDNDVTAYADGLIAERLYNRIEASATHSIVPDAFRTEELTRWGITTDRIHTYDGYKEDVSVAGFEPDPGFPDRLPFSEYIVVRPEALTAAYVDEREGTLVLDLLDGAIARGYNVVYLPRGRGDERLARGYPDDRVFVPDEALSGLDLAWHAECVLTGSGTMAREAACMDKPAVSFFPGPLLSVDRQLREEGRLYHSREPDAILAYVDSLDGDDVKPDRSRSTAVRAEVAELTAELIDDL